MAKTRSPEYPAIGLKEAIDKVNLVYQKDYQNKLPKRVIAEHMGFKGLNGGSLPVLAALNKYGLLEGRGDETRVSDLALAIVAHAPGSSERADALQKAGSSPELFAELDSKFQGGKASDQAIRSYLLTQRFIPSAADTAIRSYRETKQLVEGESRGYSGDERKLETPPMQPQTQQNAKPGAVDPGKFKITGNPAGGALTEAFNLDEGPVTLTLPVVLSGESYKDLEDRIAIVLRQAKRRAEAAERAKDYERKMSGDPEDGRD